MESMTQKLCQILTTHGRDQQYKYLIDSNTRLVMSWIVEEFLCYFVLHTH